MRNGSSLSVSVLSPVLLLLDSVEAFWAPETLFV